MKDLTPYKVNFLIFFGLVVIWAMGFCFTFKFLVNAGNFLCGLIFCYPIFVGFSAKKVQIYSELGNIPR